MKKKGEEEERWRRRKVKKKKGEEEERWKEVGYLFELVLHIANIFFCPDLMIGEGKRKREELTKRKKNK